MLVRVTAMDVAVERVSLARGEHRRPPFSDAFPLCKVPALADGPLRLPESAAIARHLLATRGGAGTLWWPATDARALARADAALCWCHATLRPAAAGLVWARVLSWGAGAAAAAAAAADAAAAAAGALLPRALATLERVWLPPGALFLGGAAHPTYADLAALCEVDQLALLPAEGGGGAAELLAAHPRVRAWAARVAAAAGPAYAEATGPLARAVAALGGGGWRPGGGGKGGEGGAAAAARL